VRDQPASVAQASGEGQILADEELQSLKPVEGRTVPIPAARPPRFFRKISCRPIRSSHAIDPDTAGWAIFGRGRDLR